MTPRLGRAGCGCELSFIVQSVILWGLRNKYNVSFRYCPKWRRSTWAWVPAACQWSLCSAPLGCCWTWSVLLWRLTELTCSHLTMTITNFCRPKPPKCKWLTVDCYLVLVWLPSISRLLASWLITVTITLQWGAVLFQLSCCLIIIIIFIMITIICITQGHTTSNALKLVALTVKTKMS